MGDRDQEIENLNAENENLSNQNRDIEDAVDYQELTSDYRKQQRAGLGQVFDGYAYGYTDENGNFVEKDIPDELRNNLGPERANAVEINELEEFRKQTLENVKKLEKDLKNFSGDENQRKPLEDKLDQERRLLSDIDVRIGERSVKLPGFKTIRDFEQGIRDYHHEIEERKSRYDYVHDRLVELTERKKIYDENPNLDIRGEKAALEREAEELEEESRKIDSEIKEREEKVVYLTQKLDEVRHKTRDSLRTEAKERVKVLDQHKRTEDEIKRLRNKSFNEGLTNVEKARLTDLTEGVATEIDDRLSAHRRQLGLDEQQVEEPQQEQPEQEPTQEPQQGDPGESIVSEEGERQQATHITQTPEGSPLRNAMGKNAGRAIIAVGAASAIVLGTIAVLAFGPGALLLAGGGAAVGYGINEYKNRR